MTVCKIDMDIGRTRKLTDRDENERRLVSMYMCQSYDQEHKKEENIIQKKFMSSYYGI